MKKTLLSALALVLATTAFAQNRTVERLDTGWKFTLGDASSPAKDFGHGTEYFNYLTKANSIHNEGPYVMKFDDKDWQEVRIPHDWVTQLPYHWNASHSHGYRSVGYKFPENSVGWYRKVFQIPSEDNGKHIELQFDGIFRDARIWVNGFFVGGEESGYISQSYDISDYVNYGGDNLVTVRVDATFEEGWFYEGAGIYRDVWLKKADAVHVKTDGTFVYSALAKDYQYANISVETEVENTGMKSANIKVAQILVDADGKEVARSEAKTLSILPKETKSLAQQMAITNPHLWDVDDPYLYEVRTVITENDKDIDIYTTTTGIREARFDKDQGFILNGRKVELLGTNNHQDHAGVGSAIPDALQLWRIKQLKALGSNAYRASHNPMTPALLDICDREGMLVIDENRLMGTSPYQLHQLEQMIRRDRNHPSIILWSDGNEEWGLENTPTGRRVAQSMVEYTHRLDPTRQVCVANAGGNYMIKGVEVRGFNYIKQNDVDGQKKESPDMLAAGTEETSGCGTRGIYFTDEKAGHMESINRTDTTYSNVIERGWKFYAERPHLAGLFYWTGFDYKGEPNPLGFPAVGSEFGILDYCGFPKDEAYYLKSWWTNETVLHILPHWNLQGHEGEKVSVWAYSNCDEVELWVNGKNLGRKTMPKNGHLEWDTVYQPGKVRAVGYKNGKKVKEEIIETTGDASQIVLSVDRSTIKADNRDVAVVTVALKDKKGRFVPTACNNIKISLDGNARILGVGNGDPAFQGAEHPADLNCKSFSVPAFNGYAQILIQSTNEAGAINIECRSDACKTAKIDIVSE